MGLFNIIQVLAGDREKETFELIKDHAAKAHSVVAEFKEAFRLFSKKDYDAMDAKIVEVCSLESEADSLRRKIEENMYSGAFLPGSRSLIFNFAEMVDKIADAAEDAARLLSFLRDREVPDEITTLLGIELEDGLETIDLLEKSIAGGGKVEEVKYAIEQIRRKEHESDEIANKTYAALYRTVKDPISVLLISKLITYTGDISDRAEDATDALSLILLLHKA